MGLQEGAMNTLSETGGNQMQVQSRRSDYTQENHAADVLFVQLIRGVRPIAGRDVLQYWVRPKNGDGALGNHKAFPSQWIAQ